MGILNTLTRLLFVVLFYFMFLNGMQVQFLAIGEGREGRMEFENLCLEEEWAISSSFFCGNQAWQPGIGFHTLKHRARKGES